MAVRGRHQDKAQNIKPVWATAEMRLDPYALPQKISYDRATPAQSRSASGTSAYEFTLNTIGATLKCELGCGLPLSLALPNRAFKGVAARAFENADGTNTVTLELLHEDAELSVPLCVSEQVEDAAADWHSWANQLGLPMIIIDDNGDAALVKDAAGLTTRAPKPRRGRIAGARGRPNFLRRRKVGIVGPVVRLDAKEIIARS